jgi:hypothetical protein
MPDAQPPIRRVGASPCPEYRTAARARGSGQGPTEWTGTDQRRLGGTRVPITAHPTPFSDVPSVRLNYARSNGLRFSVGLAHGLPQATSERLARENHAGPGPVSVS